MSTTSVYELFNTKVNCVAELRNGHGSGPAIWGYIANKLYRKDFYQMNDKEFWLSYKDDRLDCDEKAVLLSTYDNAFVEVDNLAEFAGSCRKVHKLIVATTTWDWSHFEDIGNAAEIMHKKHDRRCKGLAIGCTSVCDIWEQESPKNIKSWGVYEYIKSMKSEAA